MNIYELLSRLEELGITLQVVGSGLKVNGPKEQLTPGLIDDLRDKKKELTALLQRRGQKDKRYVSIEAAEKRDYYMLSPAQKRLYILQQMHTQLIAYNMPQTILLPEAVDKEKLESVFKKIIARHESLRTSFLMVNDEPVQMVHDKKEVDFEVKLEEEPAVQSPQPTADIISSFIRPFDLARAPLLRVRVIKTAASGNLLIIDIHHIITDGTSRGILKGEYLSLFNNEGGELPRLRLQYKDYSQWLNGPREQQKVKAQENYWLKIFAGEIPVLNLPLDFPRPGYLSFEGSTLDFTLNREETEHLKDIVKEHDITLYMGLLAIFNILMVKLSGQEDIIVGTPIAARRHPDLEPIIGMFVNTLAIHLYPTGTKSLVAFLKEVKTQTLDAYENQEYPFEELVGKQLDQRDTSRNPLFDIMLVLQNMNTGSTVQEKETEFKIDQPLQPGFPGEYENTSQTVKFDLILTAVERNHELFLSFQYCTRLFKKETVERFIIYFKKIVSIIVKDPGIKISEIEIIPGKEKEWLLWEMNETRVHHSQDKAIHEWFREQGERTPDNTAVTAEDKKLTYRELNRRADRLTRQLKRKGAGIDTIVGLLLEPSIEMITAMLGILKSGSAYLPIDPAIPQNRRDSILRDGGIRILLVDKENTVISQKSDQENILIRELLVIDEENTPEPVEPGENIEQIHHPNSLAYIIYTSGTTGKPKGVMIEHKNVVRLMANGDHLFNFNTRDTWTMFHSYYFDFSVWEMYGALLFGGKLVMIPRITAMDTRLFLELITKEIVTVLNQTPTAFYNLVNEELDHNRKQLNLKYVIFGGEALMPVKLREWKLKYPETRLINMYGITETTVHVTYKQIGEKEIDLNLSNIGRPLPTFRAYVMDNNLKLAPPGVCGELCVGGDGVGRGYINSPELTKEKFVENPYKPGEILYRSKDLVKIKENREMEYLGRIDHQVKIRGYRIELGEIETHLLKHPGIKEAVVEAREKPGKDTGRDKYLCAYIVPASAPPDQSCRESELREYLAGELPSYMQPTYFVILQRFPLSPNGKINRRALPDPFDANITGTANNYIPPRNEMERKLVKIWQEVLNLERIGVRDDFFEIGGHSLKATQVLSRIYKETNAKIELKTIFQYPTIEGLTKAAGGTIPVRYEEIPIMEKREYYELSPAQKRLWILDKFDKNQSAYNLPIAIVFKGRLDRDAIEKTFYTILKRHESLRTTFVTLNGQPLQKIHNTTDGILAMEFIDIREKTGKELIAKEIVKREAAAPFDLARGPLTRIKLLRLEDENHLFLLTIHHIVSDGWSMTVLTDEIFTLYNTYKSGKKKPLSPLRLQYKDYAARQNKKLSGRQLEKHQDYWKNQLKGEIPVLQIYTDNPRPPVKTFNGNSRSIMLDWQLTRSLNKISQKMGATLFMALMAAVKALLYRYTGQEDMVIGTPTAGRDHKDLENQVGFYLNTLAIRTRFHGSQGYDQLLSCVKETALGAFQHQDYPFDRLVDELELKRELSRSPLFDVFLVLQNTKNSAAPGQEIGMEGLTIERYNAEFNFSKFDITFYFTEIEEELLLSISYNTGLFTAPRIQRLAQHFKGIVTAIIKAPCQKLEHLDYIPEEEKKQLIIEINDVKHDYPQNKTIQELFTEQVEKTPQAVAVVFEDLCLSYLDINMESNRLGRYLKEKFLIQVEDRIGILITKSEKIVISILAVLKTGAAFVALEPGDTPYRTNYMVQDSRCKVLLTRQPGGLDLKLQHPGKNTPAAIVHLDDHRQKLEYYSSNNTKPPGKHHNTAYVVYTSGTTGKPKGVVVEHRQFNNFIRGLKEEYMFKEEWRFILAASLTFDASYRQIFIPLTIGAQLHIVTDINDVRSFVNYLGKRKINVIFTTPVIWKEILKESHVNGKPGSLTWTASSGDVLSPGLARDLRKIFNEPVFVNMYGPTETTMVAMKYEIAQNNREKLPATLVNLPLGKPLPNYEVFVLDTSLQLVPKGVVGEICISGQGVTRGYQNNPELTVEKFIKNLFSKPHKKMYRTGDMGVYLDNGDICCLGRKDNQVKIRGIRIEIEEIEKILLKLEYIEEAVVIAEQDEEGSKRLTAFFTGEKTGQELTASRIREDLSRYLPQYMIPSSFVKQEAFPLTTSGKIDRKALGDSRRQGLATLTAGTGTQYEPPRDNLEKQLAAIWEKVLKREKIGVFDNFFELGGDSITAVRLTYEIEKKFKTQFALKELFRYPTIKEFAGYILNEKRNASRLKKVSFYKINSKYQQNQKCTVIGFPPMIGFSFAFHKLGEVIKHPMVLFNMITESIDGDPIENNQALIKEFVKQIALIEEKGPLILMGWSAGGKLAFEVCQALEITGIKIDKLIMIDSSKIILKVSQDYVEKRLAFHRARLKREKNTTAEINDTMKRMRRFFDFYLTVEHTGTINADIIMVASKLTIMSPDNKPNTPNLITEDTKDMIGTKYWEDMTTGQFILYTGYGLHGDMFSLQYVEKNAQIIKGIFDEIEPGFPGHTKEEIYT